MSARNEILSKIRNAIPAKNADRKATVETRIKKHLPSHKPFAITNKKEIKKLFIAKAQAAEASVKECAKGDIEKEIISFIRQHNLPMQLRMGDDVRLEKYKIGKNKMLEVLHGRSHGEDLVTVSHAFGGAAETGTLALTSGKDNPTTLNFLAENHIVILQEKDLLLHQEDIWAKLRKTYGEGQMPRTLNYITGPSRSADIEQTLILGAHGALRLHILVVKD